MAVEDSNARPESSMPVTMEKLRRFLPGFKGNTKQDDTNKPDPMEEAIAEADQHSRLLQRSITVIARATRKTDEEKATDLADHLLLQFALENQLSVDQVKQQMEDEAQGQKPEDSSSLMKKVLVGMAKRFIKWLVKRVIWKVLKRILRVLMRALWRYVIRAAISFLYRFVIRYIVMAIVSVVGAIVSALGWPVVLGGMAIGGAGFFLYKKFFPDSPDEQVKEPTEEMKEPGPLWRRIIRKFFGIIDDTNDALDNLEERTIQAVTSPVTRTGQAVTEVTDAMKKAGLARLKNRTQDVADAIHDAAQLVGEDEGTLNAFAAIESNFDPNAGAGTTSARGLFQFVSGTWKSMKDKYGAKFGVKDDASVYDAKANAILGAAFLKFEIRPAIQRVVTNPNAADLYFGHLLGPSGGARFLRGYYGSPNDSVESYVNRDALKANHSLFYNKDNTPKTLAEVYQRYAGMLTPIESYIRNPQAFADSKTAVAAANPVGKVDPTTASKQQQEQMQQQSQANAEKKQASQEASNLARDPTPPKDYGKTPKGQVFAIS